MILLPGAKGDTRQCVPRKARIIPDLSITRIFHQGSRMLTGFAAVHTLAWSETHSYYYELSEGQVKTSENPSVPGQAKEQGIL